MHVLDTELYPTIFVGLLFPPKPRVIYVGGALTFLLEYVNYGREENEGLMTPDLVPKFTFNWMLLCRYVTLQPSVIAR